MAQITSHSLEVPLPPATKSAGRDPGKIVFSPLLATAAGRDAGAVLVELGTSPQGLGQPEAARRLATLGPNEVAQEKQHGWPRRLLRTSCNPLVILLTASWRYCPRLPAICEQPRSLL